MMRKRVAVLALSLVAGLAAGACSPQPSGPAEKKPEAKAGQPAAKPEPAPPAKAEPEKAAPPAAAAEEKVMLEILPGPLGGGTPAALVVDPKTMEPVSDPPRPQVPLMAPPGLVNLAAGKPVTTSSREEPTVGELSYVTDGKKGPDDYVEVFAADKQWMQIDLGASAPLYAVAVWHFTREQRYYHAVVVQVSDDPDFLQGVHTIYNNDYGNAAGQGAGADKEYCENHYGRTFDAKGIKARYVRLYSTGNTSSDFSDYIEVEVWGKPAAP
jgi:hypothetical protein